jgi:hypothetical protein
MDIGGKIVLNRRNLQRQVSEENVSEFLKKIKKVVMEMKEEL